MSKSDLALKSSNSDVSSHDGAVISKAERGDTGPRGPFGLSHERWFVIKLDASLLFFSVLGLICRYIDQTNLNTAFVSGMKEDLNMYGLQFNYANTCWVVGYTIGQIPGNILLTRVSPHYVVFVLEFGWSIMTLCTTWVTNTSQLYFIRFMVGLFESAYYPGLHFLIGSWYTKTELGKRASLFQAACAMGTLLSQVLQGGVHRTLNGKAGRPGWRWIFIIDAVISIPIAIGAFCMIPELPEHIKPNWMFSRADIDLGRKRIASEGRKGTSKTGLSLKSFRNIVTTWPIWVFTILYSLFIFGQNMGTAMPFWFKMSKDPKYTIEQINYYPCGLNAIQIATTFAFGWISDSFLKGRRWPILIFVNLFHCIVGACLAGTPVYAENRTPRWVLYYLCGMVYCGAGMYYAWIGEIIAESSEKRGIVMATYNSVAFSFNAWLPLLLFKQTEMPAVFKGNVATSVAAGLQILFVLLVMYLVARDRKRALRTPGTVGEDDPAEAEPESDGKATHPPSLEWAGKGADVKVSV